MQTLVEKLIKEHDALKGQVALIKQLGVMTAAGFKELLKLKELLVDHIRHEDNEMYPLLELAAKNDKNLDMLLCRLRDEMHKITIVADNFFGRYSEPTRSHEFGRDVASIFSLLSNRIITEEAVLYPRLSKVPSDEPNQVQ